MDSHLSRKIWIILSWKVKQQSEPRASVILAIQRKIHSFLYFYIFSFMYLIIFRITAHTQIHVAASLDASCARFWRVHHCRILSRCSPSAVRGRTPALTYDRGVARGATCWKVLTPTEQSGSRFVASVIQRWFTIYRHLVVRSSLDTVCVF